MFCSNCGENEANFKYTEIINGIKKEISLCSKCAKKMGVDEFDIPINFSSLFGDFLNEYQNDPFVEFTPQTLVCNKCNMTFDEFMEVGKFGCSNCYSVFDNKIENVLKRLHGETKYLGRKPNGTKYNHTNGINEIINNTSGENVKVGVNIKSEPGASKTHASKGDLKEASIEELKIKLKEAVKIENYEEAAKIRDRIKELEQGE